MRVVTIDGPAGAGKSTVARAVAERLDWRYLDTGAMYRTVALAAIRNAIPLDQAEALAALASKMDAQFLPGRVLLDGHDISQDIRGLEVTRAVSIVANHPSVRNVLAGWQRQFAEQATSSVTEGRDQGTRIFPDAVCKIYLDASLEVRARRRLKDFESQGESLALDAVIEEMGGRDRNDIAREAALLQPAPDAIQIDTSGLTLEEVTEKVLLVIRKAISDNS